jgi:hypothetical protein
VAQGRRPAIRFRDGLGAKFRQAEASPLVKGWIATERAGFVVVRKLPMGAARRLGVEVDLGLAGGRNPSADRRRP